MHRREGGTTYFCHYESRGKRAQGFSWKARIRGKRTKRRRPGGRGRRRGRSGWPGQEFSITPGRRRPFCIKEFKYSVQFSQCVPRIVAFYDPSETPCRTYRMRVNPRVHCLFSGNVAVKSREEQLVLAGNPAFVPALRRAFAYVLPPLYPCFLVSGFFFYPPLTHPSNVCVVSARNVSGG